MDVSSDEQEQDCSAVEGSSQMFEFRFAAAMFRLFLIFIRFSFGPGQVYARRRPCLCNPCRLAQWTACVNRAYVGPFRYRVMHPKDMRNPKSRYTQGEVTRPLPKNLLPLAITGKRVCAGELQYFVAYKDISNPVWTAADRLECFQLIEQFEIDNV